MVTNAHVVAGSKQLTVLRHPDGRALPATVVAFDPNRDVAILRVADIGRPALSLGDGSFDKGGVGAVFGHPLGGPLKLSPFKVADVTDARGFDIYDAHRTTRRIFIPGCTDEPWTTIFSSTCPVAGLRKTTSRGGAFGPKSPSAASAQPVVAEPAACRS